MRWGFSIVDRLLPSGALEAEPETLQKTRVTISGAVCAAVFLVAMAAQQFAVYGLRTISAPILVTALFFGSSPLLLRVLSPTALRRLLATVAYAALFCIGVARGGFVVSVAVWTLVFPLLSILFDPIRTAVFWALAVVAQLGALLLYQHQAGQAPLVTSTASEVLSLLLLLGCSLAVSALVDAGRRRLETERRVLAEQLETERRLVEDQMEVARRVELLGRLSGGIAHDFNNLLMVIKSHTHVARTLVTEGDDWIPEIEAIESAAERGASLTSQLLSVSRSAPPAPGRQQLGTIIRGFSRFIERMVPDNIELDLDLERDLPAVVVDPHSFERALLNLALNACDAMPQGGVLTITTHTEHVSSPTAGIAATILPGDYVVTSVRDTGSGIDPETLERIFEPFFTTKGSDAGTGLGLATVIDAIQSFDGFLAIDSEVGVGTNLRIYLPADQGVAEAESIPAPDAAPARQNVPDALVGGRILLAEDEDAVRKVTRRILVREGYTVVDATNGAEALEILRSDEVGFDFVLTDVAMPKMSGLDFARAAQQLRPDIPFIFMSGYIADEDDLKMLERRGTLLLKPFDHRQLLEAISNLHRDVNDA